jgi:hypothetical protein
MFPSAILATASGILSVILIAICLVLGEPGLVLYVKVECQVFFLFMINVSRQELLPWSFHI